MLPLGVFMCETSWKQHQWLSREQRTFAVFYREKNLPAVQKTQVQTLDQEDSPGEGNGYPLHYSCLENPMNRGA